MLFYFLYVVFYLPSFSGLDVLIGYCKFQNTVFTTKQHSIILSWPCSAALLTSVMSSGRSSQSIASDICWRLLQSLLAFLVFRRQKSGLCLR
jgi:hypothetical protein